MTIKNIFWDVDGVLANLNYAYYNFLTKHPKYKEMYDAFQPLKHLQLEFIEENKSLDEDVYITRFGNGEEIVVNYSMKPFKYREKYVPPRDYLLFK